VLVLTAIWGLRLGAHIYSRNRGQGEDKRYASLLRRNRGSLAAFVLRYIYWMQGRVMWFVSLPVRSTPTTFGAPAASSPGRRRDYAAAAFRYPVPLPVPDRRQARLGGQDGDKQPELAGRQRRFQAVRHAERALPVVLLD